MSERDWRLLIGDILDSINKIEKYVSNLTFVEFKKDDKTIDAVIRNFGIIGEAANKIPVEIKQGTSNINWIKIIGLRHRVIHDYFGVDVEIIWFIIENELSDLKEKLENIK
jgi:uncharacterized protein with HEPN domain